MFPFLNEANQAKTMSPYEIDIKNSISCMQQHGVILYPTDTIWGLGCDVMDIEAIRKIYEIKKRDEHKSFVLLMTDVKQLNQFIASPLPDIDSILEQFEQPTTIIYPDAINLPNELIGPNQTIAVRITKDPFCRSLIKRLRRPIVSTSANLSGQQSPLFFERIDEEIKQKTDYIVKWRQEDTTPSQASSIYKLNKDGSLDKIR